MEKKTDISRPDSDLAQLAEDKLPGSVTDKIVDRLNILGCEGLVKAIQNDPGKLHIILKDPFLIDEKFWADETKINQLLKNRDDANKCFGMEGNNYNDYFTEFKGSFKGAVEVIKRIKEKYSGEEVQYVFMGRGADILYYGMKFLLGEQSKSYCQFVEFSRFGPECMKAAYDYQDEFEQYISSLGLRLRNKKVVIVGAYSSMPEFTFYKIGELFKKYGITQIDVIDATKDIAAHEEQFENKARMIKAMTWLGDKYVEGRLNIVKFGGGEDMEPHIMEFYDMIPGVTRSTYKINNNGKYWGWLNRKAFYDFIICEYNDSGW